MSSPTRGSASRERRPQDTRLAPRASRDGGERLAEAALAKARVVEPPRARRRLRALAGLAAARDEPSARRAARGRVVLPRDRRIPLRRGAGPGRARGRGAVPRAPRPVRDRGPRRPGPARALSL